MARMEHLAGKPRAIGEGVWHMMDFFLGIPILLHRYYCSSDDDLFAYIDGTDQILSN